MRRAVLLIILLSAAFAQLEVVQEAPAQVVSGGVLQVNITVQNTGTKAVDVLVRQSVGYEPIEPEPIGLDIPGYLTPQYYYWNATIAPGGEETFWFRENVVGGHGAYEVGPALASVGEEVFESNAVMVQIVCNRDGVCDIDEGEGAISCPADCSTGVADGFCDEVADERCDPDCEGMKESADPDCECGNRVCDDGENHLSCPVDCPKDNNGGNGGDGGLGLLLALIGVTVMFFVVACVVLWKKFHTK